jgi:hypothetical protein
VICSIHTRAVSAHDVFRILQRDGRPTQLGEAIIHYGPIFKTGLEQMGGSAYDYGAIICPVLLCTQPGTAWSLVQRTSDNDRPVSVVVHPGNDRLGDDA